MGRPSCSATPSLGEDPRSLKRRERLYSDDLDRMPKPLLEQVGKGSGPTTLIRSGRIPR